jgi:hypothetical protein
MIDGRTIANMRDAATRRAKHKGLRPYQFDAAQIAQLNAGSNVPLARIPHMGDYEPKGFKLVATHFVDSSGFGAESEPAMTIPAFMRLAVSRPQSYWAIVETGQFQIYIGEFTK